MAVATRIGPTIRTNMPRTQYQICPCHTLALPPLTPCMNRHCVQLKRELRRSAVPLAVLQLSARTVVPSFCPAKSSPEAAPGATRVMPHPLATYTAPFRNENKASMARIRRYSRPCYDAHGPTDRDFHLVARARGQPSRALPSLLT